MEQAAELYLDLLKRCLTRSVFGPPYAVAGAPASTFRGTVYRLIRVLLPSDYEIVRRSTLPLRRGGHDWPADAETMVGLDRLDHLQQCIRRILADDVPGDFIEAGVWRGGVTIFMRAALAAYGVADRAVWVADSFEGLPPPQPDSPIDTGARWHTFSQLAVPLREVQQNFERYGLLDERVRFLVGWFKDTLPTASIDRLALLRVDADMYGSTMDALRPLYAKVSSGGYVVIDDYFSVDACRAAVDEFRAKHHVQETLERIDAGAAYWRKAMSS